MCEVPRLATKQRTGDEIPLLSVPHGGHRTGVFVPQGGQRIGVCVYGVRGLR